MSGGPSRAAGLAVVAMLFVTSGCGSRREAPPASPPPLVGAWRSAVQFRSGAFAGIHDLEFLYVFNLGGTMTESSNYDGAPPVPPAYGVWRSVGPNEFEAKYEFYATQPITRVGQLTQQGGWMPAGRGVLVEKITLAEDGQSFTSTIHYESFDLAGQAIAGGGEAAGRGTRISF